MKAKRQYNVFLVGRGSGCYAENYRREFIGTTMAVSAKQACNNVRFREMKDKKNPNGGYSMWVLGDYADEGDVIYTYEAELAEPESQTPREQEEQMNMFSKGDRI